MENKKNHCNKRITGSADKKSARKSLSKNTRKIFLEKITIYMVRHHNKSFLTYKEAKECLQEIQTPIEVVTFDMNGKILEEYNIYE